MTKTSDDKLRGLYAKYNAAYSAHRVFAMAIAEIALGGDRLPDSPQDSEKQGALELAAATAELRRALAEVAAETAPNEKRELAASN